MSVTVRSDARDMLPLLRHKLKLAEKEQEKVWNTYNSLPNDWNWGKLTMADAKVLDLSKFIESLEDNS